MPAFLSIATLCLFISVAVAADEDGYIKVICALSTIHVTMASGSQFETAGRGCKQQPWMGMQVADIALSPATKSILSMRTVIYVALSADSEPDIDRGNHLAWSVSSNLPPACCPVQQQGRSI
jgi:hypothetical protein